MIKQNNDFFSVLKSTSLFGAVQVYNILISIIRSKIVALWIGPTGMGIIGLLTSTIKVIGELTTLGLSTTAVREIALSKEKDEAQKLKETVSTIKKVVWFTGLLGVMVTLVASRWLSYLAFDNYDYTLAFVWISLSLLFNQLSAGQLALLQGFRRLKLLAKTNLLGNFIALIVSLPLYYVFRIDAIVPVILSSSLIALIISWVYSKKLKLESAKISNYKAYSRAKGMLKLGFMLSLSSTISLISAYIFQIYLSKNGGVEIVGYYLAGFMILNSYVGMVFNAMRTDYFPKLSGIINNLDKVKKTVSEQAIVALLLIGPLIVGLLIFLPIVVKLLYSNEFLIITGFISWAILGMLFKTLSWSMGYVILAKGDSKVFIKTAIFFNSLLLGMNIMGYHFHGLDGLGISFLIYYIIHFLGIKIITVRRYKLDLDHSITGIFIILMLLTTASFFAIKIDDFTIRTISFLILILLTVGYSIYQLNARVGLLSMIRSITKKSDDKNT